MQTFKQFIETREVKDIPQNGMRAILRHINDPILCVKFALYCAEDCFHFNDEQIKPLAQQCIDLVRKWLRDSESVTEQELRSAASNIFTFIRNNIVDDVAANAADAAAYATYTIAYRFVNPSYAASSSTNVVIAAIFAFASSEYEPYTPEWDQIYNQKLQEYTNKLKGMTTTRTGYTKHSEMLKGYDNTEEAIRLALDELEDLGEIGKDHFVYQDDEGKWVFDLGHDNILRADSREKLARLIHNDRYYLNALMRLYNANV